MTWVKPQPKHLQMTEWGWICSYPNGLIVKEFSDIGCMTYLQAEFGIEIGSGVLIGSHCSLFSRDDIGGKSGKIILHDGCKIGTHSTVMGGVEIGSNLVIPAYSFVKHSIFSQEDLDAFLMRSGKRPYNFGGLL